MRTTVNIFDATPVTTKRMGCKATKAVRSRLFVERPRPTDPSVGFCRIPTRSGPTDRPTAARSAAKIRVGPTDRPTRPRAARRKIDGRDRPTDRPCRAQRGAKFTVGTDRPTDPKQLDQVGRSAPTDRPTRYPPRGRSTNNLLRTANPKMQYLNFDVRADRECNLFHSSSATRMAPHVEITVGYVSKLSSLQSMEVSLPAPLCHWHYCTLNSTLLAVA